MRAVAATLGGLLPVYVVALALWTVGVPRTEVQSVGDGEGMVLPGQAAAEPVQLLMAVLLLAGAAVGAALVLWRKHPTLRTPVGVLLSALNVGAMTAFAASLAPPLANVLTGPDPGAPAGELVAVSPSLGPLFFGPLVPGLGGPEWETLPDFAGWFVLGTAAALLTLVYLVVINVSPQLDDVAPAPEPSLGNEPDPDPAHV